MTHDREQGIQAIIFLQAMVGITEPREKAEKGWDRMAEWEKDSTMRAYAMFRQVREPWAKATTTMLFEVFS